MELKVAGLIRFSYASRDGFKRVDGTDPLAALMDEERLRRRFELFERLTVPSLAMQTDPSAEVVVLTAEALPKWALRRLREAVAEIPGGRVLQMPIKRHMSALRAAFDTVSTDGADRRVGFRLDDDDALALDYVERLTDLVRKGLHVYPDREFSVSFNAGIYAKPSHFRVFDAVERTPISAGPALVQPIGAKGHVYLRNHRFLPQFYDHISDASLPMWIRTIHDDNDSHVGVVGRKRVNGPAQVAAALATRFHITFDALRTLPVAPPAAPERIGQEANAKAARRAA